MDLFHEGWIHVGGLREEWPLQSCVLPPKPCYTYVYNENVVATKSFNQYITALLRHMTALICQRPCSSAWVAGLKTAGKIFGRQREDICLQGGEWSASATKNNYLFHEGWIHVGGLRQEWPRQSCVRPKTMLPQVYICVQWEHSGY